MANKFLRVVFQAEDFSADNLSEISGKEAQIVISRLQNLIAKYAGGAKDGAIYCNILSDGTQGGTVITGSSVVAGNTISIGGLTFTADGPGQFAVGADDDETMLNLYNFFLAVGYDDLFDISINANEITMTLKFIGPAQFIGTAATGGLSVSGATLVGGANSTQVQNFQMGATFDSARPIG